MTPQQDNKQDTTPREEREYEQSGMYPRNGKPFRLGSLLIGLAVVILMLALASAVVDWVLDY